MVDVNGRSTQTALFVADLKNTNIAEYNLLSFSILISQIVYFEW